MGSDSYIYLILRFIDNDKKQIAISQKPSNDVNIPTDEYSSDSYNLGYTEEEFIKEFKEEDDDEKNYENDPRYASPSVA